MIDWVDRKHESIVSEIRGVRIKPVVAVVAGLKTDDGAARMLASPIRRGGDLPAQVLERSSRKRTTKKLSQNHLLSR